jgi:hypothetical protein
MIDPSLFLRRAILVDAIFSGVSALLLTFGAGTLAPLLNLPEALLRKTGLFLIAYAALVGWLGTRQSMPKTPLPNCNISGCAKAAAWWRHSREDVIAREAAQSDAIVPCCASAIALVIQRAFAPAIGSQ